MVKTPSEFGESAYIALKNDDQSGFRSLFIDAGDADLIFETQSSNSKMNREEFDSKMKETLAKLDAELPANFSRLRDKGVEMGINWEQVEFKGVDVSAEREDDGFRIADIKTFFTSNELDFTLSFREVAKLDKTYTAAEFPKLKPYRP